jgi:hypothetical protein
VNRLTRILPVVWSLFCAALVAGCTSELTAPESPAFAEAGTTSLTPCTPLPEASASALIGPNGGVLKAGPHSLKVPRGALSSTVLVTLEAPSSAINRVGLEPRGLKFEPGQAAYLVVSYANCSVPPGSNEQVVRVSSKLNVLQVMPSLMDSSTLTVEGKLALFSDYALSTYAVVY